MHKNRSPLDAERLHAEADQARRYAAVERAYLRTPGRLSFGVARPRLLWRWQSAPVLGFRTKMPPALPNLPVVRNKAAPLRPGVSAGLCLGPARRTPGHSHSADRS
jgi:hypothetical protein